MRTVPLLLLLVACGGKPLLANAPAPPAGAVAGVAAAAAAAMTLANPNAATRKPEKRDDPNSQGVDVKESVPPDVFDRLDHPPANDPNGSDDDAPAKTRPRKGPPPKLPSPRDISDPSDHN